MKKKLYIVPILLALLFTTLTYVFVSLSNRTFNPMAFSSDSIFAWGAITLSSVFGAIVYVTINNDKG